jgi:hypothetical protein
MSVAPAPDQVILPARESRSARRAPAGDQVALVLLYAIPLAVTVWGIAYYAAPVADRVRSPLHALLRPSGAVGQSFGVLGLALFLFMWLYPLRRSIKWLAWAGALGSWMRVHTVAGLTLPVLVAVHAGWRFDGLIGLGYWSMLLVSLSGLVGRYLYVRIPRSRNGLELSIGESVNQRRALVTELAATLDRDPTSVSRTLEATLEPEAASGLLGALRRLLLDDLHRWLAVRSLRRMWSEPGRSGERVDPATIARALKLARREIALGQQLRMLEGTQRLFRFWHVAHRPVAITALLAVLVHVAVAVAMGQTWLR